MSNRLGHWIKFFRIREAALTCVVFVSFFAAATPATLVIDSKLKANPHFQAETLLNLSRGDVVVINKRQRGWYQVKTQTNQTGWLTLLQVKYKKEQKAHGKSELSKLVSLRRGADAVTATTGVRGIGETDVKNSKPNFVALEQAIQYQSTQADARAYANQAALKSLNIKYREKRDEN